MATLMLTDVEIRGFPEPHRAFLLGLFHPAHPVPTGAVSSIAVPVAADVSPDAEHGGMTTQQAQDILNAIQARTRTMLQHIASAPADGLNVPDLAATMGLETGKLGGCWSGITRVSKRILGKAVLFEWDAQADGLWRVRMTPTARTAFRTVLGIE